MSITNTFMHPSYWNVVEPLLREHNGESSELCRLYPNFDPGAVPEDTNGISYLHFACQMKHFHTARGLLQCGASLLQKTKDEHSVLHWACGGRKTGKAEMITWLLSQYDNARTTVNWVDQHGWAPLHMAALLGGNVAVIRTFLKHGADITLKTADGETPAQLAREPGYEAAAEVLETAARIHVDTVKMGEWCPHKHSEYAKGHRDAVRSVLVLAEAHI